jgi:1-phosphatidylinositol-4-phosphate 5-kinase
MAQTDIK